MLPRFEVPSFPFFLILPNQPSRCTSARATAATSAAEIPCSGWTPAWAGTRARQRDDQIAGRGGKGNLLVAAIEQDIAPRHAGLDEGVIDGPAYRLLLPRDPLDRQKPHEPFHGLIHFERKIHTSH